MFSIFGPFLTRRCFFLPPKIILKLFWTSEGWPKNREKLGFFGSLMTGFLFGGGVFPCGVLVLVFLFMYLLRCKCVIRPCCLTCSFYFLFVFRYGVSFWGGRGGYSSFYVNHFNGPVSKTKTRSYQINPNIWNFVFDVLLWGLYPHTFTWPR